MNYLGQIGGWLILGVIVYLAIRMLRGGSSCCKGGQHSKMKNEAGLKADQSNSKHSGCCH